MRYKLVFGAGFATGYYLGAKAGRQRFEQIQRQLDSLRRNPRVAAVTGKINAAVDAQVVKAKDAVAATVKAKVDSVVETARGVIPGVGANAGPCAPGDGSPNGTATIPPAANPGYSSSR